MQPNHHGRGREPAVVGAHIFQIGAELTADER